jgi:hypothetical protein
MMNIDAFKLLVEQKGSVFRDGGNWRGRCPAHNDDGRRGDLTFRSGDDGRIVLHCFGGCSARSVVEAMGLQWSDLFSENGHSPATRAPMRGTPPKHAYPTINEATEAIQRRLGGSFTAMWTYHNAEGIEVLYVVRLDDCEKAGNHKQYRPIHPVDGGFSEGDPSGKLPLYNLPAILANATDPVFVNEGEKATDASTSIGLLSTTSAHG